MTQSTQFSSDEERWSEISNFPSYSISSKGRVMNTDTNCVMSVTSKPNGLLMVGMMQAGLQRKRSLALLVANAFVPRVTASFDTPIHLNGDRSDNHYTNLAWRPLWFARKYMAQFEDNHQTYNEPIEDVETGEYYKNSMEASIANGVLDGEIRLSMMNNTFVWPTGQVFRDTVVNR
jgi:hypothetical protein